MIKNIFRIIMIVCILSLCACGKDAENDVSKEEVSACSLSEDSSGDECIPFIITVTDNDTIYVEVKKE